MVEFEPGTTGSEITELPTKPWGSWRVQLIEKALVSLSYDGSGQAQVSSGANTSSCTCKWSALCAHFLPPRNGGRDRALLQNDRRKFLNSFSFFIIPKDYCVTKIAIMVEVKNLNTLKASAESFMLGLFRDKTTASAYNILVIAEICARAYISFFWLSIRNLESYENHLPVCVCDSAFAVQNCIAYESSRTLEYNVLRVKNVLQLQNIKLRRKSVKLTCCEGEGLFDCMWSTLRQAHPQEVVHGPIAVHISVFQKLLGWLFNPAVAHFKCMHVYSEGME